MINVDYQDGSGIKQMDEALLEKREGKTAANGHLAEWVEYWDGDKLVHRSVHMIIGGADHPAYES